MRPETCIPDAVCERMPLSQRCYLDTLLTRNFRCVDDGVHVWNAEGLLIGKIHVGSVVANFNFARGGVWIFAEERLFFATINARGALASIEGH
jgi:hypothetical protein